MAGGVDPNGAQYVGTGPDFTAAASRSSIRDSRDSWADARMMREPIRDPRDPRDMRDPHDSRDFRNMRDVRDPRDAYVMRAGDAVAPPPAVTPPAQGATYDRKVVPIPPGAYPPGYGQMNPGVGPGPGPGSGPGPGPGLALVSGLGQVSGSAGLSGFAGSRPGDRPGEYMQIPPYDGLYSSPSPHDPLCGRAPYQEKGCCPPSRMSNPPRPISDRAGPSSRGSTTPITDSQDFDPSDPVARRAAHSPNVNVTPLGPRGSEERNLPRDRDSDRERDAAAAVRRPLPPPQHLLRH